MDYLKLFDDFVAEIEPDETKTGGITYILVFINKKGDINYNIATGLIYLISNFFDYDFNDNISPEQILTIELENVNAKKGAIYKRNGDKFQRLFHN